MIGLLVALLYAGYRYLISGSDPYGIYLSAAGFLHNWYVLTTLALSVVYAIIALLIPLVGMAIGADKLPGRIGGVLGFIGGGALSFLILIYFGVSRGCLIVGSYLLTQALIMGDVPSWDSPKLVFGVGLLMVGLLMGRSSPSKNE